VSYAFTIALRRANLSVRMWSLSLQVMCQILYLFEMEITFLQSINQSKKKEAYLGGITCDTTFMVEIVLILLTLN
jgi:hypothetical protein